MKKKYLLVGILIATIVLGLFTGGVACIYSQTKEFNKVFIDGVYVEGQEISGLTKDQAKEKIEKNLVEKNKDKKISVFYEDLSLEIPYEKLEASYNIGEVLEEGFQYGHEDNMFKTFLAFTSKEKETYNLNLSHSYNEDNINRLLKEFSYSIHKESKDSTMKRVDRRFVISPDQEGRQLNIEKTSQAIGEALNLEDSPRVEAVVDKLEARIKPEYFKDSQTHLASFYTSYTNSDKDRNYNLKIGAEKINTVLEPGEEFALSKFLEPITSAGGYKNSNVIVNGELVRGIGGGVCQVATTLYNSVLLTNLDITRRQNHSMPVGYIPLGRDATFASGAIDFKFKNPSDHPVYIESYCEKNKLHVNIFGHESLKPDKEIKFESEVVERISPPPAKYEDDPSLMKGQEVEKLSARSGQKVDLYKLAYSGGKLVDRKLESSSYYRPRAAIIRRGTKEPPAPTPVPEPDIQVAEEAEKIKEEPKEEESPKEEIKEEVIEEKTAS